MDKRKIGKHMDTLTSPEFWTSYQSDEVLDCFKVLIDLKREADRIGDSDDDPRDALIEALANAPVPPDSLEPGPGMIVARWDLLAPFCEGDMTDAEVAWMKRHAQQCIPDLPVGKVIGSCFSSSGIDPLTYMERVFLPRRQADMFRLPDELELCEAE